MAIYSPSPTIICGPSVPFQNLRKPLSRSGGYMDLNHVQCKLDFGITNDRGRNLIVIPHS